MESRKSRSAGRVNCPSDTIFMSISSDMRRMRRCARLKAVPPPNTTRQGAVSTVLIAASALTTYQSFSTSAGPGNAKCLDFEQVLKGWVIAQGQVPDCHHGAGARNVL